MHNFCEKMSKYSEIIYCLQKKTHFSLEVSIVYVISSIYVLNCFNYFLTYILRQNVSKKIETKKI